jgi:hypothetical protein
VATAITGRVLGFPILSDRFRPLPHITWARQDDATVLLDADRGLYYTLNEVGSRIWDLLIAGEPVIEILRCLAVEFEVATDVLEMDAAALLGRLLEARLIERIPL